MTVSASETIELVVARCELGTAAVGEKPCIIFIIQCDFLNYADLWCWWCSVVSNILQSCGL